MVDLAGDLGGPESDDGPRIRRRRRRRESVAPLRFPSFGLGLQQRKEEAFLTLDVGAQERLEAGQVGDQRHGVSRAEASP